MPSRISDVLQKEHREIESYYDRIRVAADKAEQREYQNLFTWELARHSIGEELVVYPAFEKYVPGGRELADKDRQEHQAIKTQLKTFQNLHPSDQTFIPTLKTLMNEFFQHSKEEEQHDLPTLEQYLSQSDSESYSRSYGRTKMFVPSRSHPSTPNKPPFETAVGLLTAPVDYLTNLFREWPDTTDVPDVTEGVEGGKVQWHAAVEDEK